MALNGKLVFTFLSYDNWELMTWVSMMPVFKAILDVKWLMAINAEFLASFYITTKWQTNI